VCQTLLWENPVKSFVAKIGWLHCFSNFQENLFKGFHWIIVKLLEFLVLWTSCKQIEKENHKSYFFEKLFLFKLDIVAHTCNLNPNDSSLEKSEISELKVILLLGMVVYNL
jgi:hypothetical protein